MKARKKNAGFKNAIKSADFYPKRILAEKEDVRRYLCGVLLGEATGTFFQPDPADPTNADKMQEGIVGAFQFTNNDGTVSRGPRLWVPDTIAQPLKDALRSIDPETGEVTATNVRVAFGYEVYSVRSSAPVGYTWEFVPVFDEVENENDPMQRLNKLYNDTKAEALPAPDEAPQIEAPKGKAKAA